MAIRFIPSAARNIVAAAGKNAGIDQGFEALI
jgi:hypothetical protein